MSYSERLDHLEAYDYDDAEFPRPSDQTFEQARILAEALESGQFGIFPDPDGGITFEWDSGDTKRYVILTLEESNNGTSGSIYIDDVSKGVCHCGADMLNHNDPTHNPVWLRNPR